MRKSFFYRLSFYPIICIYAPLYGGEHKAVKKQENRKTVEKQKALDPPGRPVLFKFFRFISIGLFYRLILQTYRTGENYLRRVRY